MPTKTWKKNELSWKKIGAKRNHFEAEDCAHPLFSIECKHRQSKGYPKTVRDWFEQARVNAPEGKIPILAIHLAGEIRSNDLVVIRRSDFEDLVGRLNAPSPAPAGQPEAILTVGVDRAGPEGDRSTLAILEGDPGLDFHSRFCPVGEYGPSSCTCKNRG